MSCQPVVWFRLVPLLSPHHRIITFDNLGTGDTRTPAGPYTMAQLATAAADVATAAGLNTVHVVGMSLGGLIAQELSLQHPQLVSSLILVSTHAGAPHMTSDQSSLDAIARAADLPPEERTQYLSRLAYAKTTPRERIDEDLTVRAQHPTTEEGYRNQVSATLTWDRLSELAGITCPTLVLHGAEDQMVSLANAHQLVQQIPSAQLTVLSNTGHQLFTDQPQAGSAIILDFVRDVDGGLKREPARLPH